MADNQTGDAEISTRPGGPGGSERRLWMLKMQARQMTARTAASERLAGLETGAMVQLTACDFRGRRTSGDRAAAGEAFGVSPVSGIHAGDRAVR